MGWVRGLAVAVITAAIGLGLMWAAHAQLSHQKYVMVVTWTLNPNNETVGPVALYTFPDHAHCQLLVEGLNEDSPYLQPVKQRLQAQALAIFQSNEEVEDLDYQIQCVPEQVADGA